MSIPFRRISNIDRTAVMAQSWAKRKTMLVGDKENFETGILHFENLPIQQIPPAKEEITEVRFAEPYSPEADEFRPVPLSMGIDFLEVSTGPPWSVGDDIELSRRREIDYPRYVLQRDPTPLPQSDVPTCYPGFHPEIAFVSETPIVHDTMATSVLLIMEPSEDTLEQYRNFTHLKLPPETTVPLTYLRLKIPVYFRDLFLNEKSATHTLHLTNLQNETAVMPVHDLVIVTQCFNIGQIITFQTAKTRKEKPSLYVSNVPDLDSFGVLLKWLYTNDEDELYEILSTSQLDQRELLCGFALNCRFWGIVDSRVCAVIRALLEDLRYGY